MKSILTYISCGNSNYFDDLSLKIKVYVLAGCYKMNYSSETIYCTACDFDPAENAESRLRS
jgi:hypothetical protein